MKSMYKTYTTQGFTLIELLVVIAIIGLLASVILVSLNGTRLRARDVKRKADLQQLMKAIVLYLDSNVGVYPTGGDTSTGDWPAGLKTALLPYMSKLPLDPLANNATQYYAFGQMPGGAPAACANKYYVYGYFEGTQDPDYGKYNCSGYAGLKGYMVEVSY